MSPLPQIQSQHHHHHHHNPTNTTTTSIPNIEKKPKCSTNTKLYLTSPSTAFTTTLKKTKRLVCGGGDMIMGMVVYHTEHGSGGDSFCMGGYLGVVELLLISILCVIATTHITTTTTTTTTTKNTTTTITTNTITSFTKAFLQLLPLPPLKRLSPPPPPPIHHH